MGEGMLEFYIYILSLMLQVVAIVFLVHQSNRQHLSVLNFMDNVMDNVNKLAQLGMIHAGSKTAMEAVNAVAVASQSALDIKVAEKRIEEELLNIKEKPRRLVGFYVNGTYYKLEKDPTPQMLAKIPENTRVYED